MYSNIWAEYITSFTKQPSQDCVSPSDEVQTSEEATLVLL